MKRKTHEEFIYEMAEKHPNIEVIGVYVNARTKVKCRCKIDGYEWDVVPSNLIYHNNVGCPKCAGNIKMTREQYIEQLVARDINIEVIGEFINLITPIKHHCITHNVYWDITPRNVLQGHGCPECKKDKIHNARAKTHKEYKKELVIKNPTIQVVGEYINANTPILHYCTIHDVYWKTAPSRVLYGAGCPQCHKERFRKTRCKTHDEYVRDVELVNPYVEVVGQYIDSKTKIKYYCKKHNVYWSALPSNILKGCGCPECGKEKTGNKNKKTHQQYVEDLCVKNKNIEVIGEYIGANTPITHRCKIDGHEWNASPANILYGKGCPMCNITYGEQTVRNWLDKNDITYVIQHTFMNCADIKLLPFDFYLPNYNIVIEYDGEHHYRPVNFGGISDERAYEHFITTQKHDKIKNEYCKQHKINLLRIPYFKNIEEELEKFFIHLI